MAQMKQNAIFLSANKYDFVDDNKKTISGLSVHYCLSGDLAPCENEERTFKGYKPAKSSFPLEAYSKLQEVPGVYELDISVEAGSDGKMKAVPKDFVFVTSLFE
jgi:hypothetical protein